MDNDGCGMSTVADVEDWESLRNAIDDVRSDVNGVERRSWVIAGHVNNNPNLIELVAHDTSAGSNLDDFRQILQPDQVLYCLLRMTTIVDMSTAVKFVYVHWVGEKVPIVLKGRYGVVHGSVRDRFHPHHLLLETSNIDELTEEEIIQKLEHSTGTKSHVLDGPVDLRQERGFTQFQVRRQLDKGVMKSVAPEGAMVDVAPELNETIGEVRLDDSPVTWVLAGFEEGNLNRPLSLVAKGSGDIEELKQYLEEDQVMFALYRTTDVIDEIQTIKFVYIYWIGENVRPLTKGKVSAYAGPVAKVFSPAHVSLSFSSVLDIESKVIEDKVMASSGSKSFVK